MVPRQRGLGQKWERHERAPVPTCVVHEVCIFIPESEEQPCTLPEDEFMPDQGQM